jgi:hypothetical protein
MPKLLAVANDPKTIKNIKNGELTGILYLAPGKLSGYQVCAFASGGCLESCLWSAGRGGMNVIQNARIAKTKRLFEDRDAFMSDVIRDVESLRRKARKLELNASVRLNGTSDIKWEKISCGCHKNLMEHFPDVTWYDYTKIPIRYRQNLPSNYKLTFSLNETNEADAREALAFGVNVAAVWRTAEQIPTEYLDHPVIIGDESDARHLDQTGVIVALYAKGSAIKDKSGFVLD